MTTRRDHDWEVRPMAENKYCVSCAPRAVPDVRSTVPRDRMSAALAARWRLDFCFLCADDSW